MQEKSVQLHFVQGKKAWPGVRTTLEKRKILVPTVFRLGFTLFKIQRIVTAESGLYNLDSPEHFSNSIKFSNDRMFISKWLIMALLKKVFSGQPDNVLRPIREIINQNQSGFPFIQIIEKLRGSSKSMIFTDDDIYNLFFNRYGQSSTFQSLVPIYPTLDFNNKFHQDHIFPKHLFTINKLKKRGYSDEKIDFYMENFNCLANLQMLEGIPNQEKAGKYFDQWVTEKYPDIERRKEYMRKNYIPDIGLSFDNFEEFISARKQLMTDAYNQILKF